jgi:putative ABC transport system ATP-binding protein
VTATRGGEVVLRDVGLTLREGVTALLGPSGSGKSSLLRLLNRLADPERGVVRFRGEDVTGLDVRELRRRACLVPQLPAPLPGTVADNLRYGPALFGRAVGVEGPLEMAGLTKLYVDREASQLSVGEQQRVMLARALAHEPEVLLLDEPTSALDDYTKGGVERTLAELAARSGLSMVLVTHDRPQAERMAGERIVELEHGRVLR